MTTRIPYQISSRKWLHRIDHNTVASDLDFRLSAAAGFGVALADVGVARFSDMGGVERDALRLAADWGGRPPNRPVPLAISTGNRLAPLPKGKPEEELRLQRMREADANWGRLTAAQKVEALRDALRHLAAG